MAESSFFSDQPSPTEIIESIGLKEAVEVLRDETLAARQAVADDKETVVTQAGLAQGHRETSEVKATEATDAATSASAALFAALMYAETADSRATEAEASKTAAESAKTAAESAKTAAESAKTAAESAKTAAESAKDIAVAASLDPVNYAYREYWVDSTLGADTNEGTEVSPFATVEQAVNSVPIGGVGTIRLTENKTYVMSTKIEMRGKALYIGSSTIPASEAERPILEFESYDDGNYNRLPNFVFLNGGGIRFDHVKLKTDGTYNNSLPNSSNYSFVNTTASSNPVFIGLRNTTVVMGEHELTAFKASVTPLDMSVYSCTITGTNGTLLSHNVGMCTLGVTATSKDSGVNWHNGATYVRSNV